MTRLTKAERILKSLGIMDPRDIDLEAIAWELGVVSVKERELDGCEARIVGRGDRAIITLDPRPIPRRRRFSLAHELGHWMYHRGKTTFCAREDITAKNLANPFEQAANSFAADLILPSYLLAPMARRADRLTTKFVREMAGTFDATRSATTLKLVELGHHPALAICYTPQGWKWFTRSSLVPGRWFPEKELHHDTYAFDLLHGRGGEQPNPRKIGADAFFGCRGADRYEVLEQSFSTGENEILTIVTVTDGDMLED